MVISMQACWCGGTKFRAFGPEYGECLNCSTLVYLTEVDRERLLAQDDESGFYGKNYWLERQKGEFGTEDIFARSRSDLAERNLHWLSTLQKYVLPPARVVEIGCSHGSFVALMRHAGYDASGMEMSPWVVEFGKATFGVPVSLGPIESWDAAPGSLDVIVAMDVLEHLPDPVGTMRRCLDLLKPDGLLLIQTPQFNPGTDFKSATETKSRFLEMLIPEEHIYLFSRQSVTTMFSELGAAHIEFEPALFAHYDMFFTVSRASHSINTQPMIEAALQTSPNGRFIQAMLDLRQREMASEADRLSRGEQIDTLTTIVKESEADRAARGEQIVTLTGIIAKVHEEQIAVFADVRRLFVHKAFKWLAKFSHWNEVEDLEKRIEKSMDSIPAVIAIDLTPVLPGGENGGAKIFVLDLIRQLASMAPATRFILLTQAASHEELGAFDQTNVERRMVIGPTSPSATRPLLKQLAAWVAPRIPGRIRRVLSQAGYRLNMQLKRRGAGALLRNLNVDLLFCPFTAPTYFEPGIPTVCTIYDLQYKTYPEFFAPEDVAHRSQTFIDASRRATVLAAISNYSRQSAIVHGELDPTRIRTIHLRMAHRIAPQSGQSIEIIGRLGLAHERYLVYPANFWKHKNHEMLLTAFSIACHTQGLDSDIKLVCTGAPGARQEWLSQAAAALSLGSRVVFPGYLSNSDLATLLSNSRGVVFPSLYEGFGLPVIEAMAAGVPVACSNTTSLPEVAADAAIMFDPRVPEQIAQAIVSLVNDETLRASLTEAGQLRVAEFSDSKRMANEYWDLFRYAMIDARQENSLSGAHADGWLGEHLKIKIREQSSAGHVEVKVFVPGWLPQPFVVVQPSVNGTPQGASTKIKRGEEKVILLPVPRSGGRYDLQFKPTFVPARIGQGGDQRELSVMLKQCTIVGASERIDLFPETQQS